MPTSTFFNLPVAKREKLINAVKQELARVPFDQVSINRIVNDAQISRGSYYQYFNDKEDMLEFILQSVKQELIKSVETSLKNRSGDIFASAKDILDHIISMGINSENSKIIQNIITHFKMQENLFFNESSIHFKQQVLEIYNKFVDYSSLRMDSLNDFVHIAEILLSQVIWTVAMIFRDIQNENKYYKDFCIKLEILKHGMAIHA